MSGVVVGGRRYAAGLYWLERGGARATARTARKLGRPWCVHRGARTGFAEDDICAEDGSADGSDPAGFGPAGPGPAGLHPAGSGPEGLSALALALQELIGGEFWMALVADDAADAGGEGRCALVKARDGAVLADGDEVFDDPTAAIAAFERARAFGWALHATPGMMARLDGGGAPGRSAARVSPVGRIDPAALGEAASRAGAAILLTRAVPARGGGRLPVFGPRVSGPGVSGTSVRAALGIAVLAALAGAWFGRDALLTLIAAPEPAPRPAALRAEPELDVAVDGGALIAACRAALIERPPFMTAWRIKSVECSARFADPELTGLRPELAGRPVLLARWRLAAGHAEAMHRRLAEANLSRWHAAAVADGRAWAVTALAPVLRPTEAGTPSFLDLRRDVDRAFGGRGARLGYARGADGAWTVRIDDPGPLSRLGPLAGGIAGLEIVALSRGAHGNWRLEGRPAAPRRMTESRLRALGVDPAGDGAPGAAADSTDRKEVPHGTQDHRDL